MKLDEFQQKIVDSNQDQSTLVTITAGAGCVAYDTPIVVKIKDNIPQDVYYKLSKILNDKMITTIEISKLFEIKDLLEYIEIDTPDGWQPIDDVFETGDKKSYNITTETGDITVSEDHWLLDNNNNWSSVASLHVDDIIQTRDGNEKIISKKSIGTIKTMDITVGHENHRYYTQNIISHNSGKSTVFANKIARLILEGHAKPDEIITLTFTNKAARDIKSKIKALLPKGAELPHVSTIHSLFIKLLRDFKVNPIVMNEWGNILTLRSIIEQHYQFDTKGELTAFTRDILAYVDQYQLSAPDINIDDWKLSDYVEDCTITSKKFNKIYKEYDKFKREKNLWSYNDLISSRVKEVIDFNKINSSTKYLFNDEAHDETLAELLLIRDIASQNILYNIQDNCQEIYGWRFSRADLLADKSFWADHFNKYEEYKLLKNYRSTENILKVSNLYRSHLDDIQLIPTKENLKGSVKISQVEMETHEGKYIAVEIKKLLEEGTAPKDITILVRSNMFIKSILEPHLIESNIPYTIDTPKSKKKMFESPINKIFLSFMEIYSNNENLLSIISICDYYIGVGAGSKKTLMDSFINTSMLTPDKKFDNIRYTFNNICEFSTQYSSASKLPVILDYFESLIRQFIKTSEYNENKINLIRKTITNYVYTIYEDYPSYTIHEIFAEIITQIDSFEDDAMNKVKIMTYYGAKGLSLPYVFVSDMSLKAPKSNSDSDNSLYVALSRAETRMYIVSSSIKINRSFGKMKQNIPSIWTKTYNKLVGG